MLAVSNAVAALPRVDKQQRQKQRKQTTGRRSKTYATARDSRCGIARGSTENYRESARFHTASFDRPALHYSSSLTRLSRGASGFQVQQQSRQCFFPQASSSDTMKCIDLGVIKLPLEGDYNTWWIGAGIGLAMIVVVTAFSVSGPLAGPALALVGPPFVEACKGTMLVTALYALLYYNFLGAAVDCFFSTNILSMIKPEDVQASFYNVAGRFSGNTLEQAPVFLTMLWLYSLFVDSTSGTVLGAFYIVQRMIYPLIYSYTGKFRFEMEMVTQPGYGIIGNLMLGCIITGFGGDWVGMITASPIITPVIGFLFGSFGLFPGLPLGPVYAFINYKLHKALHFKEEKSA